MAKDAGLRKSTMNTQVAIELPDQLSTPHAIDFEVSSCVISENMILII